MIDAAVSTVINSLEQPIQLPLETAHAMPLMTAAIVVLIVNPVMMMACAGAAQERHRAVEELLFRDGAVLVGIERVEQNFGAARGA